MRPYFLLVVFLYVSSGLFSQIPTDGLVGYWSFDGNANDESANGNHGTVNGATLTTDRFNNANKAYSLSGSDVITVPNGSDLAVTEYLTISYWFKTSQSTEQYILQKAGPGYYTAIGVVNSGKVEMYLEGINGPSWLSSLNSYNDNHWHHAVFIYDYNGGSNNRRIYVDNILEASDTKEGKIGTNIKDLIIGHRPGVGYYSGQLDDIRIYNRVLTTNEITALYNDNGDPQPINAWQVNGNHIHYTGAGNVGIGIDAPTAKLTVNGPILSTEVKVKIDVSTYPDFVFKPEYNLLSLEEVEQYTDEHGHLPEIPRATDIAKGVNLGEMNIKLLKKIEELTLYLIRQNKQISRLKEENQALNEMGQRIFILENKLKELEDGAPN